MPTLSLDMTATFNESLSRRVVGDRYYAGVPCAGYLTQVVSLAPGQTAQVPAPPTPVLSLVVAADANSSITLGWTINGVTTEVSVNLLAIVTPPAGAQIYVRNDGVTGSPVVPCKLLMAY